MDKRQFKEKLKEVNIILTDQMEEQFDLYFHLLNEYNKVMDLTAVIEEDLVYERHFYNSLTIAFNNDFNNLHFCDVGAGAGFPSIPLKIVFPNMKLTIIDPLNKRMEFLRVVIDKLDLKDVNLIVKRVEDISLQYKETFDIVSARAVARLNVLAELVCQIIKVNGTFIAMKGEKGIFELNEAKNALKTLKLELVKKEEINPSINLFFKKIDSVDNKYPRNYALIKKKPL